MRSRLATAFAGAPVAEWLGCVLIVLVGTAIRLPQTRHTLMGDYAFRLTQTAFPVREYAAHGVQLFKVPLPVFGSADNIPFEWPLFEVLARELMHLGISDGTATRLMGLLSFQAAALLWWVLLRRWHSTQLAFLTLVLVQALPYGLHWGATALIDFFSVALGLALVLCIDTWLRDPSRPRLTILGISVVFAWLLFLVKITTVPAIAVLVMVSIALSLQEHGWRPVWRRALVIVAAGPGTALVPLWLWTRYADRVKGESAATEFLTSTNTHEFMFGGSRLDPASWTTITDRVTGDIAGWLALPLLLGVVLGLTARDRRTQLLTGGLCLAALAPVLVVFNLYVVHSYYLITVYPLLTALSALGAVRLAAVLPHRAATHLVLPAGVVAMLLLTTLTSPSGRADVADLRTGSPVPEWSRQIERATPPDARIIMLGCDWDPRHLWFAHRTGLMFRTVGIRIDQVWRENDIDDYQYVARCRANLRIRYYLPHGYTWTRTRVPQLYRLHAPE